LIRHLKIAISEDIKDRRKI